MILVLNDVSKIFCETVNSLKSMNQISENVTLDATQTTFDK